MARRRRDRRPRSLDRARARRARVRRCDDPLHLRRATTSLLAVFNLIPIPPLDGSTLLFRVPAAADGLAGPAVPRPVRLLHPARRHLRVGRPLSEVDPSMSTPSWWAPKVRQFRAHLRRRVDAGGARGPGGLAHARPARAVRHDARRRPAPRPRRRRDAPRRRASTDARGPRGRPAPRRRQGRHRRLAAGRLVARARRTAPGSGASRGSCPGFGGALERLRDHAETSARCSRPRPAARRGPSS